MRICIKKNTWMFGFTKYGLNRIEACVSPDDQASQNIITRLGFQKEGLMREHYHSNDEVLDSVLFYLLKREWEENNLK